MALPESGGPNEASEGTREIPQDLANPKLLELAAEMFADLIYRVWKEGQKEPEKSTKQS